jgi:hypothetical protein
MREDVLRGVRLGAILCAGLLAGAASYRVFHAWPDASAPASEVQPAVPVVVSVPDAPIPNSSTDVPPPPPPSRPTIYRHPPRPGPAGNTPASQTIVVFVPEDSEDAGAAKAADAAEAAEPIANAMVQKEESPAQEERGIDNSIPKSQSRGKRWWKAVGRFLHITRGNDADQQALRQP